MASKGPLWSCIAQCQYAVDARFRNTDDEASFKTSVEPELFRFGAIICFAIFLTTGCRFGTAYLKESTHASNSIEWVFLDARTFSFLSWLSLTLVSGVLSILHALRLRKGWFDRWNWEALHVGVASYCVIMLSFGDTIHAPQLFGETPDEVWSYDPAGDEALTVLITHFVITMFSLYAPVRSCVFWIVPLSGIVSYAMLLHTDDTASSKYFVLCLAVLLAILEYHGAQRRELLRRHLWILEHKGNKAIHQLFHGAVATDTVHDAHEILDVDISTKMPEDGQSRCGLIVRLEAFFENTSEGKPLAQLAKREDQSRLMTMVENSDGDALDQIQKSCGLHQVSLRLEPKAKSATKPARERPKSVRGVFEAGVWCTSPDPQNEMVETFNIIPDTSRSISPEELERIQPVPSMQDDDDDDDDDEDDDDEEEEFLLTSIRRGVVEECSDEDDVRVSTPLAPPSVGGSSRRQTLTFHMPHSRANSTRTSVCSMRSRRQSVSSAKSRRSVRWSVCSRSRHRKSTTSNVGRSILSNRSSFADNLMSTPNSHRPSLFGGHVENLCRSESEMDLGVWSQMAGVGLGIAHYTKVRRAGFGAQAEVYEVVDEDGQRFALKEVRLPGRLTRIDFPRRLKQADREARLLKSMSWASAVIVCVRDCWFEDSFQVACMIMEWLPNVLSDVLDTERDNGTWPERAECIAPWLTQMAAGVAAMHLKCILHRDLKPSNILLTQDKVNCKIADLGCSRMTEDVDKASASACLGDMSSRNSGISDLVLPSEVGNEDDEEADEVSPMRVPPTPPPRINAQMLVPPTPGRSPSKLSVQSMSVQMVGRKQTLMVGTKSYMSPEMQAGSDYNSSTDIFSLGMVLHEMLSIKGVVDEREFDLKCLCQDMLSEVPHSRPRAYEIVGRPVCQPHMEVLEKRHPDISLILSHDWSLH